MYFSAVGVLSLQQYEDKQSRRRTDLLELYAPYV
jgi:hypothetical protein